MHFLRTVDADGDGETVRFEEATVVLGQQRAIGGNRESDFCAAAAGQFRSPLGRGPQYLAVDQRLAAEKRQIEPGSRFRGCHQQVHGAKRVGQRHVFRGTAELALLGVAIGAAEVALLSDRQRQRAERRGRQRHVVDEGAADQTGLSQQFVDGLIAALGDRCFIACEQLGVGVEQSAAVGDEEMAPKRTLDQMNPRRPRSRHAHVSSCDRDIHGFLSGASTGSGPV